MLVLADGDASMCNWAWLAGRPWPGMWALDLVQAARFCHDKLSAPDVTMEAENSHGWPPCWPATLLPT